MNVFKINFEIFRKRFKLDKTFKLLEFSGIILLIILLIHIGFILFGKYESMYLVKSFFFFTIIIEFIFPNYNLNDKLKVKSFFGKLKTEEIEKYYISKNLIRALIVGFLVFVPYRLDLIKLSLFYVTILSMIFLIVILLRKIFSKIDFQSFLLLIRFSIMIFLLLFAKKGTGEMIKDFSIKIPFVIYFLLFFAFVYTSIKLLNSIKSNYIKKHNFSKILVNFEKYFGYNFLYIVRSRNFIRNISLFYTISILTIYKESIENATIAFAISIVLNGISNLFSTFKIESSRFNFIYHKDSLKNINNLKIVDSIKIHLFSLIFIFPVIYFKLGTALSFKIILLSTILIIFSNILVTKIICKKRYVYNKNDIIFSMIMDIILTIIVVNLII